MNYPLCFQTVLVLFTKTSIRKILLWRLNKNVKLCRISNIHIVCFEAYWALFTLQECEKLNYYILEMQIYPISAQKVKFWLLSCTLSKMLCFIIKGKKKENLIQSRFCLSNFPLNVKCTFHGHRNIRVYFQGIIRTHQPGPRRYLPILIYKSLELSLE